MDAKDHVESGAWVGRQQAFAIVASQCSAALQEIKQSRVYEKLSDSPGRNSAGSMPA
jgi:hypothetical protein